MLESGMVASVNPLISYLFTKVPSHSTSRKAFRLPLDSLEQFPPYGSRQDAVRPTDFAAPDQHKTQLRQLLVRSDAAVVDANQPLGL